MLTKFPKILATLLIALLTLNCHSIKAYAETEQEVSEDQYDIVIKGGTIYNPSTEHELENYYLGIKGSKIETITKKPIEGKEEIDAEGLVISPGFIDLVSYDPNSVGIRLKVFDGVTSNLAMHGGTEDAATWYPTWERNGVLTNFGASSFVTRHRWPIVGQDINAEITNEEDIKRLVEDVRKNIENGALGISFSLEYIPGVKHELKPLLELANEYHVPTFYHLRYSDEERGLDGIQEVIDLGKETGAIIHIMHINSTGGTFVMDQALEMVRQAKEDGLDITADFYPYDFWATYLGSARFLPGWQERFKITYEDLQIGGTDIRITEETFDYYRSQNVLVAALGSMPESELIMLLKDPDTMIGSDTIIEPHLNNHPRGAGAFSRVFGKYVREEQVLSMMDAIKKVSYFPAKRMESSAPAMKFKGRIEVGADADITIFDPDTITDKATVKEPATPSEGVEYVIINGVITKDPDGIVEGVAPGKPIRSYFVDEIPDLTPNEYTVQLDDEKGATLPSVYELDGNTYVPLEETFEFLNIPVNNETSGKITIGDFLNLEIGNDQAIVRDETIQLSEGPIIFKENTYISIDDLVKSLETDFEIGTTENTITFSSLREHKETVTDTQQTENKNNTSIFIGTILIVILIVFAIWISLKQRRKKDR